MSDRTIVTTQKAGKAPRHSIHRTMPHDPQPVIGKPFQRLGIVIAVKPMSEVQP